MHGHKLSEKEKKDSPGDYDYDHGAFLGDDYSQSFNELTPEESQRRLMKIVDRIDTDEDFHVSEEEIKVWVRGVQEKEALRESEEQWLEKVAAGATHITWQEYRKETYGFFEDVGEKDEITIPSGYDWSVQLDKDQRRFNMADLNKDGALDRVEFQAFVHPEEHTHMQDIVLEETLEDMDKGKDGKLSIHDFIFDIWQPQEGEEEPEWVTIEKDQFTNVRDKNKDGFLDKQEVRDWILPEDIDLPQIEAHHLLTVVDFDNDGLLSKDEILHKWEVFVGSTATHYGALLMRHDEF
jgi:Ca2+-binding EF-hand superfamily protein